MITINSLNNPVIKFVCRLKKANFRKKNKLILVDGVREIVLAIENGWLLKSAYYCSSLDTKKSSLYKKLPPEKTTLVTENVFKKIAYKENPDGFLAVFNIKETSLKSVKLSQQPLIIVLEGVEKPGNLGAVIRTSAAAGVDAIIINHDQIDIYNPNVIRASEGEIFSQVVLKESFINTLSWLKKEKIKALATSKKGNNNYSQVKLNKPVALIFGSEALGLSQSWLLAADDTIRIPIKAKVDSLNLSVAVGIIIFEALRQRKAKF